MNAAVHEATKLVYRPGAVVNREKAERQAEHDRKQREHDRQWVDAYSHSKNQ